MEIRIELSEDCTQTQVVIKASSMTEEVQRIFDALSRTTVEKASIQFYKGSEEFYFSLDDVLFLETSAGSVFAHTAGDSYEVKFRLYELEEVLPSHFIRISKSTIANIKHIYSIERNLTSSSLVQFQNSIKQVYSSRMYYQDLQKRLERRGRL